MTRFHLAAAIFLSGCALSLWRGHWILGGISLLALLCVIGLGVVLPQLSLFGPYVCRGNPSRRAVALTFDDGPDGDSTPALLDLLRNEGVPATFFCVGRRVQEEPGLVARMVKEGHLVENHSFAHSNLTNCFGTDRLRKELEKAQSTIQQVTHIAPTLFRPPMGLSNPRVFKVARALGLRVIGWTVRGLDTRIREPERVVVRIVRRLKPGAIILLHDGNIPAARLVMTVKLLLASLRERGYEVVRLERILG